MGSIIIWIGAFIFMYFFPNTWIYYGLNFFLTFMIVMNILIRIYQLGTYFSIGKFDEEYIVESTVESTSVNFIFISACAIMGSLLAFGVYKLAEPYLFYTYIVFFVLILTQLILVWEPKESVDTSE